MALSTICTLSNTSKKRTTHSTQSFQSSRLLTVDFRLLSTSTTTAAIIYTLFMLAQQSGTMGLARFYASMPVIAQLEPEFAQDFGFGDDFAEFDQSILSLFEEAEDIEPCPEQLALSDIDPAEAMQIDAEAAKGVLAPPEHLRAAWGNHQEEAFVINDSDSDSGSSISDYDSDGNEILRLQLPVASELAQRRFLARGEDLQCVAREQYWSRNYTIRRRRGKIIEPEDLFRAVRWGAEELVEGRDDTSPLLGVPPLNWEHEWEVLEAGTSSDRPWAILDDELEGARLRPDSPVLPMERQSKFVEDFFASQDEGEMEWEYVPTVIHQTEHKGERLPSFSYLSHIGLTLWGIMDDDLEGARLRPSSPVFAWGDAQAAFEAWNGGRVECL